MCSDKIAATFYERSRAGSPSADRGSVDPPTRPMAARRLINYCDAQRMAQSSIIFCIAINAFAVAVASDRAR